MADNEWYETHKKNVAAALKKAKGVTKDEAVLCALVKSKDGSHQLCAGIAKNKMVMDAKKAGAKVISDGTLFSDDGDTTFEVTEGDASVRVKFAAAAAEVLGSPMAVTVMKAAGSTAPEIPVAPPPGKTPPSGKVPTAPPVPGKTPPSGKVPTAPPVPGKTPPSGKVPTAPPVPGKTPPSGKAPPPPAETAFTTRLKRLLPRLQKAMGGSGVGKDIKLKVSQANLCARKKAFAKANEFLTSAEKLAETPETAFTDRLKGLMPRLRQGMGDPKSGSDVKLTVSEASLFARKRDFAKANDLLTDAEKLAKAPETDFTARLKASLPNLQKAMGDPKAGQDIKLKVSQASLFARKRNFARANELLSDAEKGIG